MKKAKAIIIVDLLCTSWVSASRMSCASSMLSVSIMEAAAPVQPFNL
jgi:hypothetical protein